MGLVNKSQLSFRRLLVKKEQTNLFFSFPFFLVDSSFTATFNGPPKKRKT
jgi:hypothetical protein